VQEMCTDTTSLDPFFCNPNGNSADNSCTTDRTSTGICQVDSRRTYDGCARVKEYSDGGCTGHQVVRPGVNVAINGWYKGPFSRCIHESPGFGRNGYHYVDRTSVKSQCYEMRCLAGQLHVVIDGTLLRCPSNSYINLDQYPGGPPAPRCPAPNALGPTELLEPGTVRGGQSWVYVSGLERWHMQAWNAGNDAF
jgi:hypothetical protein